MEIVHSYETDDSSASLTPSSCRSGGDSDSHMENYCIDSDHTHSGVMHLSKYCPTYPPTGKRSGFDLILTPKHAPDQGNLINVYK